MKAELDTIEKTYDVSILFACEAGSRTWGFPSKNSDYDVRFIYVHHPHWYLSIDEKRDVIELPINDLLDMNGWDVKKALKLLRKSNPSLLEWLHSEIVYYENEAFTQQLRILSEKFFSPLPSLYHYLHMANANYEKFLRADQVKIKKYFYTLRPLLACKWIEKYETFPPMSFEGLMAETLCEGRLTEEIQMLLSKKMGGDTLHLVPRNTAINEFIEKEIKHLKKRSKTMKSSKLDPTDKLNQLFRTTLFDSWGWKL